MFDTDTRPSTNGVIPATIPAGTDVTVPPVVVSAPAIVDDGFDRQREVDRLNQMVADPRFRLEAIALALATIGRYDPARHRLTGKLGSYHALFQAVAFDEYMRCPNIRSAANLLDRLIAERA